MSTKKQTNVSKTATTPQTSYGALGNNVGFPRAMGNNTISTKNIPHLRMESILKERYKEENVRFPKHSSLKVGEFLKEEVENVRKTKHSPAPNIENYREDNDFPHQYIKDMAAWEDNQLFLYE